MLAIYLAPFLSILYLFEFLQAQVPLPQPVLFRAHELKNSMAVAIQTNKKTFEVWKVFAFATQATIVFMVAFAVVVIFFMFLIFVL